MNQTINFINLDKFIILKKVPLENFQKGTDSDIIFDNILQRYTNSKALFTHKNSKR